MRILIRIYVLSILGMVVSMSNAAFGQAAGSNWKQSAGPEGGDVRTVAASTDGSTVVAGLSNGKLYRTRSIDPSWTELSPLAGLRSLSAQGNISFAHTTNGLFLSYDFGSSWMPVVRGSTTTNISPIVRAKDGLYFIASDSIYRSTDAGDSWSYTGRTGSGATMIGYSGDNEGGRLLAASASAGVFASSDKGATWTRAEEELPSAALSSMVTVYDREKDEYSVWICVTDKGIYYTEDGGERWKQECDGLPQYTDGYPNFTKLIEANGHLYGFSAKSAFEYNAETEQWTKAAHLIGKNIQAYGGTLYSSSQDGIELSADGGATWQRVGEQFLYSTVTEFSVARKAVLAAAQNGIFRTVDDGDSWQKTGDLYPRDITSGNGVAYAASLEGIHRSLDDGLTWELSNTGIAERLDQVSCISANNSAAFAGYYEVSNEQGGSRWISGGIYRSTDDGATWSATGSGLSTSDGVPVPMIKLEVYNDVQFALALDGLYRSTNNGESWDKAAISMDVESDKLVDIARVHDTILVASRRSMFRSIDTGRTWQTFSTGLQAVLEDQQALLVLEDTVMVKSYDMVGQSRTYRLDGDEWVSFTMSAPPGVEFTKFFANGTTLYAGSKEHSVWTRGIPLQAGVQPDLSKEIGLRVYPNPVTTTSTVSFSIAKPSFVRAGLYDLTGSLVMQLESQYLPQGVNTISLPVGTLAAGSYVCRITMDDGVAQEQVVLLK